MSRYPYSGSKDGGDVGGYVIISATMRIIYKGNRTYLIRFNELENLDILKVRKKYNIPKLKIVKQIVEWGLNFFANSVKL